MSNLRLFALLIAGQDASFGRDQRDSHRRLRPLYYGLCPGPPGHGGHGLGGRMGLDSAVRVRDGLGTRGKLGAHRSDRRAQETEPR